MPKTQVNCPNCRQPVTAEIEQLFDINQDPTAKQRLLSGVSNLIQCPLCGYQGNLASPIVYHDPDKELLLTFVPAELGLPHNEQERIVGGLINQAINKLPQEKRKAYLLQPQATLTLQGLLERILEEDGITKEMIQAQQDRLNLIQRLAALSDESALVEMAKQEDALIDAEFFTLMHRLTEAAMMSGDEASARQLSDLQKILLPVTTYGRQLQAQTVEIETAVADLRAAGDEITREKMLELVMDAPNDERLQALVGLARPILDYQFFQMLSERIDRSRGDGRERLVNLRTKLLEMTQEIDRQIETHVREVRQIIDAILQSQDVEQAMAANLGIVDQYFIVEATTLLEEARQQGDLEKSGKLQKIIDVIQEASQSPPEVELIEEFLDAPDDDARAQFLEVHQDEITQEFLDMLSNIALQAQSRDNQELADRAMAANRSALRFSMKKSLRG